MRTVNYPVKVVNVDVYKNSVETSQDFFANRLKCARERDIGCHWENGLVVDLKIKQKEKVQKEWGLINRNTG
jgi:hypothetical protein